MALIKKPQSPMTKDGESFYPITDSTQVIVEDGKRLNAELSDIKENISTINSNISRIAANFAGCVIMFVDEDGNPTDEPYIHWTTDESGTVVNNVLPSAEEGAF